MKKIRCYALYKGDEIITVGTQEELARYLNVAIRTIRLYMQPSYQKQHKDKNTYLVFKIEEDEEI